MAKLSANTVAADALNKSAVEVRNSLEKIKGQLAMTLPKHMTPERIMRIIINQCTVNPQLLACSRISLLRAVLQCAILGLEPGVMNEAWLIPYRNRKTDSNGQDYYEKEVQFQIGYKGAEKLAMQTGLLSRIATRVVYEKDEFEYEFGLEERLVHRPAMDDDSGKLKYAYAIAYFREPNIPPLFVVLGQGDINRRKKASKTCGWDGKKFNYKFGCPWVEHEPAMWMKSAIFELCKRLPHSIEREDASRNLHITIENDGRAEIGEKQFYNDVITTALGDTKEIPAEEVTIDIAEEAEPTEDVSEKRKSKTDQLAEEMEKRVAVDEPDPAANKKTAKVKETKEPEMDSDQLATIEYLYKVRDMSGNPEFAQKVECAVNHDPVISYKEAEEIITTLVKYPQKELRRIQQAEENEEVKRNSADQEEITDLKTTITLMIKTRDFNVRSKAGRELLKAGNNLFNDKWATKQDIEAWIMKASNLPEKQAMMV